jgi:hypothetical protein
MSLSAGKRNDGDRVLMRGRQPRQQAQQESGDNDGDGSKIMDTTSLAQAGTTRQNKTLVEELYEWRSRSYPTAPIRWSSVALTKANFQGR